MEVDSQEPNAPQGAPSAPSVETPVEAAPAVNEATAAMETPSEHEAPATEESVAIEAAEASPPVAETVVAADWGHLRGLQAVEVPAQGGAERAGYAEELAKELSTRAARFVRSVDDSLVLSSDGVLRWLGDPVARVIAGDTPLAPRTLLLADEALAGEEREAAQSRANLWLAAHIRKLLGPLVALAEGSELPEGARGLGAKIAEAYGVLERERVRNEVRGLDQTTRGAFRKLGVRFGSLFIYVPPLLKPGPRALCALLWTLRRGADTGADRLLAFASAGRTSFANDGTVSPDAYRVAGFRLCGERVVRVDILERLSDLIRAATPDFLRGGSRSSDDSHGFLVTPQMTSLTGCSGEAFASILRSLGYETAKVSKAAFEAARRQAPTEPIKPVAPAPAAEDETPPAEASETGDAAETAPAEAPADAVDLAPTETGEAHDPAQAAPVAAEAEAAPAAAEAEAAPVAVEAEAAPEAETAAAVAGGEPEAAASEPEAAASGAEAAASEPEAAASEAEAAASEAAASAEAAPESGETVETAAEAVDEEIEVWRPAPRRPRAPQRPPRPERAAAPEWRRRPSPPPQPEEARPAAAAAEPVRHEKRRDESPRRFEGKNDKRGRDERRDAPPRRDNRPADPDSPFAKLAALKPLLEQRDKRN